MPVVNNVDLPAASSSKQKLPEPLRAIRTGRPSLGSSSVRPVVEWHTSTTREKAAKSLSAPSTGNSIPKSKPPASTSRTPQNASPVLYSSCVTTPSSTPKHKVTSAAKATVTRPIFDMTPLFAAGKASTSKSSARRSTFGTFKKPNTNPTSSTSRTASVSAVLGETNIARKLAMPNFTASSAGPSSVANTIVAKARPKKSLPVAPISGVESSHVNRTPTSFKRRLKPVVYLPKPKHTSARKQASPVRSSEVIPTSDVEELELTETSVIILGSLEVPASTLNGDSRMCSRKSCYKKLPQDSKFRMCDACRAYAREFHRRQKVKTDTVAGTAESAIPSGSAVSSHTSVQGPPVDNSPDSPNLPDIATIPVALPSRQMPTAAHNAAVTLLPYAATNFVPGHWPQGLHPMASIPVAPSPSNYWQTDPRFVPYFPPHPLPALASDYRDSAAGPSAVFPYKDVPGPSPVINEGLKLWMSKLRIAGKLKCYDARFDVSEPTLGKRKAEPWSSAAKKRSRVDDTEEDQQYLDLDALCVALRSHVANLRRLSYRQVTNFAGSYSVVAGSTTTSFESNSKLVVRELVQKAALPIRSDLPPSAFPGYQTHHSIYQCLCADNPANATSQTSQCGGRVVLVTRKVSGPVNSGSIFADKFTVKVIH